jgi:tetratricopeptide (TPR) repeat protein
MKLLLLLLLLTSVTFAQQKYSSKSKKAISLFEEGMDAPRLNKDQYGRENYTLGLEILNKAIEKDPTFWEAYLLAGEYAEYTNQPKLAIEFYEKAIQINPFHNSTGSTYFFLGMLYFEVGDYPKCIQTLDMYTKNKQANPQNIPLANQKVQSSYFAIESMKNPNNFKPINLGPAINTEAPEYFPTITVDGKTILFTRRIKDTRVSGPVKEQEDFYISHLKGNAWSKAEPMPSHINTTNNEGAPTIAADGRSLIFIACPDPAGEYGAGRLGRGSCDMFVTKRIGSSWGQVLNLPGLPNSQNWETQPSLSADGKTLYFIRGVRLPNGTRSSDIYVSALQENGTWGPGVKLPNTINSPQEEESVLIHPDGKTYLFHAWTSKEIGLLQSI